MTILSVSGIAVRYGTETIIEDISFSLNEGDRLSVIGVNGAGKTTLLRIIAGELTPSEGSVFASKETRIGMLRQNTLDDDAESLSVTDYMYGAVPDIIALEKRISELENAAAKGDNSAAAELSAANERFTFIGGREYRSRCEGLLLRTGFSRSDFSLSVSSLSGGQRTRLALARILFSEPDILMLDEPTNHLDIETLEWLEGYLAQYKKTVIIVSHDRYFLDRVTNKTLMIENRHSSLYTGAYTKAMAQRDADRAYAEKQYKLQQKEIARIKAHIEQQREFAMERNFVTIRSREKMLARMEKHDRPRAEAKPMKLEFKKAADGANDVLLVKDLTMAFPGKPLFSDVGFLVRKGERVFIAGQNGTGKSTFMKIVCGILSPVSGYADVGENVKIGYYDQENQGLCETNRVIDEMWALTPRATETEVRSKLALFLFRGEDVNKEISLLSGGERARLTLAKLVSSDYSLLLLDEPTNHLDIGSREALEEALDSYDGTIIAVSHDRYFIDRLAQRMIELNPADVGGCMDMPLGDGGYEGYRAAHEAAASARAAEERRAAPADGKQKYLSEKEERAQKQRQEKLLRNAQQRIPELEAKLEKCQHELYGEAAADYMRADELTREIDRIENELLELYELTGE